MVVQAFLFVGSNSHAYDTFEPLVDDDRARVCGSREILST